MRKYIQMLLTVVLAFAIILSMATGVLATEQEHIHEWVLKSGGRHGHNFECNGCGQLKLEDHTVDSAEICTVCGYYQHTHNWQCAWSSDYWHCMVCSGCGEEEESTHRNNNAGICTICGHTPHEHIWQYNGKSYAYNHDLRCTQCATTTTEDHIYGNDGKCTVCGNPPPHEHQWKWDGNKSNYYEDHVIVCSCGAKSTEQHHLVLTGKQNDISHEMLCEICGFTMRFGHSFRNEACCTVCGYPGQGTTESEVKPSEATSTPVETRPAETAPKATAPVETQSAETLTEETEASETKPDETEAAESEPTETKPVESVPADMKPTSSETMSKNAEKEDLQRSSSVGKWVAIILVVAGGLGTVMFFLKKKSS